MLLRHANEDSGEFASDIETILRDAVGAARTRTLWVSSVVFAELRAKHFKPGKFKDVGELARHIRTIATVVTPDPNAMLRAARLRNIDWCRPPSQRMDNELPRCMTLGDALHLVSALVVKEQAKIGDLEFLTFDNKSAKSIEADHGTKTLPLLQLKDYTHGVSDDPDVFALLALPILRPMLPQKRMEL